VCDAEAFLHERLGDLDAALRLYISSAQQANRQLQDAVLAGKVPLMQLPPGYCLPGCQEGSRRSRHSAAHGDTEQECWGLGRLLAQLDALALRATQAVATAAASTSGTQQQEGVADDIQQASDELSAASHAAAALLHQLDPSHMHSSSACKPDRAAPSAGAALLSPGSRPSAAVPHQLAPPIIDLYKSWMAELSPRLKLKGLGAAVAPLPAIGGAKLGAAASSCGASSTAMAHAGLSGLTLPAVPPELLAAWQALQAAVAFCQRNTRASSSSSGPATASSSSNTAAAAAAAAGGHQLWYELMDIYVANLRALHDARDTQQHQPGSQVLLQPLQQQQQQQQLVGALLRAVSCQVAAQDLPGVLRGAAAAVASQQMLPGLLRLLLDEVVCCMADHLPLLDIVGHVLQQHGNERFGEFRPTLLGLFGATGYDSAIMAAANRLISGDAFAAVRHAYGLRQLARAMHEHQQQQEIAADAAAASAGSSRSAAVAPVAGAGMGSSPAAAVQSAMLLGVLGPGSYDSSSSSSSRIGSRYSLSQADRDLIQGILGAGGMRLQLQPAGVAANQLAGGAGEFKAAAQAVADTGRVFRGEMDLALELAMLQSLQEHQQHQHRQQHGKGGELWGSAWDAHGQGAAGQQQQPGDMVGLGAASAARATHSTSSFDIDDLLTWSHTNMA